MSQHTPAPWTVAYDNADESHGGQWYDVGPARVWFPYNSSPEQQAEAYANAHLISAAPDLLAACKLAMQRINPVYEPGQHHPTTEKVAKELRAAIAKADPLS